MAFSPKGDILATGGDDKLIKYWNVADGKELRKSQGHGDAVYSVAFHPDGSKLASGSVDKTIRIWNVADGKELHKLDGHPDDIYAVAYSRDGRRLASVGNAGHLFVWDANEAKPLFHQRIATRHANLRAGLEPRRFPDRRGRVGQQGVHPQDALKSSGLENPFAGWVLAAARDLGIPESGERSANSEKEKFLLESSICHLESHSAIRTPHSALLDQFPPDSTNR